jgi:hypothetical protein
MHNAFDDLATLIGRILADRWLRQQAARRGQPRCTSERGITRFANSDEAGELIPTKYDAPAQADAKDGGTNRDQIDDSLIQLHEPFVI